MRGTYTGEKQSMRRPHSGSVPVEMGRWAERARGEGGEAREAAGDGVYPTDGTEITLPQREEASTFSVALSDAVVRRASEGRGEGCKPRHIRGTSVGPRSS